MCWPPTPYFCSRPLRTPQSRELSCPGSDLEIVASSQLSRSGCRQPLSQAPSGLVRGLLRTPDHSTPPHCVGHGGMSLGLLVCQWYTEMDRQKAVCSPLPCCASPAARGRARSWTGMGRTGRSARGRTWTLSPWTTRTAEPRAARRPGPACHVDARRPAPLLPGRPGRRELLGRCCALHLYLSLKVFFLPNFCDFQPI